MADACFSNLLNATAYKTCQLQDSVNYIERYLGISAGKIPVDNCTIADANQLHLVTGNNTVYPTLGNTGYLRNAIIAQYPCAPMRNTATNFYLDVPWSNDGYGLAMGWNHTFANNGTLEASGILSGLQNSIIKSKKSVIAGGQYNQIGTTSLVGTREGIIVAGGVSNQALASYSSIVGGAGNTAGGTGSFIGGGTGNMTLGADSAIVAGNENKTASTTAYNSFIGAGKQNTTRGGWSSIVAGAYNTANGDSSFIGAGDNNTAVSNWSAIGAGYGNTAGGIGSFIGGGTGNMTEGTYSVIGGGNINKTATTNSYNSFIGAGKQNIVTGGWSSIVAGSYNLATGNNSFVGAGTNNEAIASYSSIVSGSFNIAAGTGSFIGGGTGNMTFGDNSTIVAGAKNSILASYSSIVGGAGNTAGGTGSFIGGGTGNMTRSKYSFVGAGSNNISGFAFDLPIPPFGTITVEGDHCVVVGGLSNNVIASYSSIVGGVGNTANGIGSFIGGGTGNMTVGTYSVIGGGAGNKATGDESFVGGGRFNQANGTCSVALGYQAVATHLNSFVFSGSTATTNSFSDYSFTIGSNLYYPNHGATMGAILTSDNSDGLASWKTNLFQSGTWTPATSTFSNLTQDTSGTNIGFYTRVGNIIQFSAKYFLTISNVPSVSFSFTSTLPYNGTGTTADLVATLSTDWNTDNPIHTIFNLAVTPPSTYQTQLLFNAAQTTGSGNPLVVCVTGQYQGVPA